MSLTLYKHHRRDPAAMWCYWMTPHDTFIFLPSLPAFLLLALLLLLVIEQFSKHVSVWRLPLSLESLIFCVCVCFSVCVLVSVYGFWYSFSDTAHLSETAFHMIIQKALFRTIVQGVLMYPVEKGLESRYDSEGEAWTGETHTKNAVTENLSNRRT